MRIKSLLAVLATVLAFGLAAPKPAEAFGFDRDPPPRGWGVTRDVNHYIYYPRYRHKYRVHPHTDPYAYYYEPRGYYTKSTSRYWVGRHHMKNRYRHKHRYGAKYRYKPAWGYRKPAHRHRD